MTWISIVTLAVGVAAAVIVHDHHHRGGRLPVALAVAAGPRLPVVHVGATEQWRPALEVGAPTPSVVASSTAPDLEELTILADFDALIASWRTDPPWLTEFRDLVDAAYARAGLDTSPHHRWREGTLDVPTAEWPLVLAAAGAGAVNR